MPSDLSKLPYRMLNADQFSSPWAYLDAKQRAFTRETDQAFAELSRAGWRLLPNHPVTGVWRASRRGAYRTAQTSEDLVRLCRQRFDREKVLEERARAKEAKKKEREAKKKAVAERKAEQAKVRAAKKAAREAKRREA